MVSNIIGIQTRLLFMKFTVRAATPWRRRGAQSRARARRDARGVVQAITPVGAGVRRVAREVRQGSRGDDARGVDRRRSHGRGVQGTGFRVQGLKGGVYSRTRHVFSRPI